MAGSSPPKSSSPKSRSPASPRSPQSQEAAQSPEHAQVGVIEADEDAGEEDPTLGSDAESSTASLSSSILDYRTINGRTYHSDRGNAAYWGANDERQSEAMDIGHHMWTLSQDGALHLAPLKDDIQKALDIGTGTGIWAIDFADEYPQCEVIGTDVSPIQPGWVPPNCKFEIEDCNQEWTFESDSFDYVHFRYLIGCIPDWPALFKQAYRVLKPGGWIESFEVSPTVTSDDNTVAPDSALAQWDSLFIEASKKIGNSFTVVADQIQKPAIEEAGFVNIKEWNGKCPLSPWPKDPKLKEIGRFGQVFGTQDPEGFVNFVATFLGWSSDEVHVYLARFRSELRNLKHHPYVLLKTVWAQKPLDAEPPTTEQTA
ncbi:hypothetical protein LCI18_005369 [Fusarium solani-melongenae]|uniref:Uncharacterized protein n=1 Tax=Fusarium solani subsp. cucurbitae TaxID=2747967 RepID=A0ACD3YZL4_FUSSC|nr:hypothetical protein LCI18_005369 [Fusarium solani-melongenae]